MCRNPATVIELYPVVAVITVVHTFAICETGFAFVKVIPFYSLTAIFRGFANIRRRILLDTKGQTDGAVRAMVSIF